MNNSEESITVDKSNWAIGGTTMIGLGVGFIYLQSSALIFVASIIIGVGAGLVIAPVIALFEKQKS